MGALPSEYFQYYYFEDEVLRRADGEADDARRGHPRLGAGLLGALRGAGAPATRPSSTRPLARRHPRARAGDRLHGRRLQRPRRDAAGQRAQRRARSPASPTRWWSRRSATATPRASGRCRCRACRRTCAGSSRRWRSTSRRPPTRRGRATRATPCARWPRTRWSVARAGRAPVRGDGRGASRAPARTAATGLTFSSGEPRLGGAAELADGEPGGPQRAKLAEVHRRGRLPSLPTQPQLTQRRAGLGVEQVDRARAAQRTRPSRRA